jgi:hypothetical protein
VAEPKPWAQEATWVVGSLAEVGRILQTLAGEA